MLFKKELKLVQMGLWSCFWMTSCFCVKLIVSFIGLYLKCFLLKLCTLTKFLLLSVNLAKKLLWRENEAFRRLSSSGWFALRLNVLKINTSMIRQFYWKSVNLEKKSSTEYLNFCDILNLIKFVDHFKILNCKYADKSNSKLS